jgi:hypothetical protein
VASATFCATGPSVTVTVTVEPGTKPSPWMRTESFGLKHRSLSGCSTAACAAAGIASALAAAAIAAASDVRVVGRPTLSG